ncbi:MAG: hypothetical protein K6T51_02515 [Rubrobacteraceae bacterium]|nr:hypothetical protein [Rubrobacteraceae bacterium]MCL6437457.1 hypothetical protein [Rubrobacteraceae bacterium]
MRSVDPDEFTAQVNYLAKIGRMIVPQAFAFVGQDILFTGDDPFSAEDLAELLPEGARCYIDDVHVYVSDVPEDVAFDLVVVGRTDYSEEAITDAIDRGDEPPRFLPQEGFLDELLFGNDWWNVYVECLDAVLEYHPGLQYVKSLETFPWPGTDAEETDYPGVSEAEFQPETPLYNLGYRITGLSRSERWEILCTKAVPELGLQEVAETIARHCRVRKRQFGGREKYAHAIAEWEHDLDRLKREFYSNRRYKFSWPRSEP